MTKVVYRKYKNEKIHLKSYDINKKTNRETMHIFCDKELITPIKRTLTRVVSFKNIKAEKNENNIIIGVNDNPCNDIIANRWYGRQASLDVSTETYANFEIDNTTIKFSKCYNEYKDIVFKSVIFKLLNHNFNDDGTINGEILLTLNYSECPICGEFFFEGDLDLASEDIVLGIYLFDDEENIKVTIMHKEVKVKKTLSWNRYYKNMYIYKKKTNMFYKVENYNTAGSTYLKNKNKRIIKNCTYGCAGFFSEHDDYKVDFRDRVLNHLKETFGKEYDYTFNDAKNIKNSDEYDFIYLLQIKKKYNIKNTFLANLILHARRADPNISKKISGKTEKEIMNYFKVNTKKLKKIDEERKYNNLLMSYYLLDDVNSLNTILDKSPKIHDYISITAQYKNFYYQYRKNNTEKRFVNQIINNESYILSDTQKLFEQIKGKMKDYAVDYSKGIKELHDIFSKDIAKLENPNQKIKKNKAINNIFKDVVINGIKYSMAKDTDELIKIGATMDICVGGYGRDAVSQRCYIVAGYDSTGKAVTCIELVKGKDGFEVAQVKKRKNYLSKASENNALVDLFNKNNVKISTRDLDLSNDYHRLKEDESEHLGKVKHFTYARNVPEEILEEMIG